MLPKRMLSYVTDELNSFNWEVILVMADNVTLIGQVLLCVFPLQAAGVGSGGEGDPIAGLV